MNPIPICTSNATGTVTEAELLPAIDSNGGVTVRLTGARKLVLRLPRLKSLDLIDSPRLEELDLSALRGEAHLSVRGCPSLKTVRFPPAHQGVGHVHIDSGTGEFPAILITGAVARLDVRWGAGQVTREVPHRGAPWKGVLLTRGAAPDAASLEQPGLEGGLLVWAATEAEPLQVLGSARSVVEDISVIKISEALRSLEWLGTRALRSLRVEQAASLMVLRLRTSVVELSAVRCDMLRALTTEGQFCGHVSVKSCCSKLRAASPGQSEAGPWPRKRSFLVIDVPCENVSIVDTAVKRLSLMQTCLGQLTLLRCQELAAVRLPRATKIRAEGNVPFEATRALVPGSRVTNIQEGSLGRLAEELAHGGESAWLNLLEHAGKLSPSSRAWVLRVLAEVPREAFQPRHAWRIRERMYVSQTPGRRVGADRWIWSVPPEVSTQVYRHDFAVFVRCSALPVASQFIETMPWELLRPHNDSSPALMAMLPWLFTGAEGLTPARLNAISAILRAAAGTTLVPPAVSSRLAQGLPFLLRRLESEPAELPLHVQHVVEAARSYYLKKGGANEAQAWLEFEVKRDRPAVQAMLAAWLVAGPGPVQLSPERRAALNVLMLTGQPLALAQPPA